MPLLICTFALIISCAKGAESLNAPPPWRTAEGRSAVSLSLLSKRHGTALAVTFYFRWLWPYSTLLPEPWAATDGPCWRTSRESHPSEDLSELPPSLVAVAGEEYHYQIADEGRTGLLHKIQSQCETARHRLFYGRMGTAQHLIWPSLMRVFRTDGLGASSNVALASLSGASRQLTYPVAGYSVFKEQGS